METKRLSIKKILLITGSLFAVGLVGLALLIVFKTRASVLEFNEATAAETISQFKTLRAYYTANVVNKVKAGSDLKISENHESDPQSIPLPATMIQDLSQLFAKAGHKTALKLYSEYPFPNRENRQLDAFATDAIRFLNENPEEPFTRTEVLDGQESIRYAIADKLVNQSCVDCHNSRAGTPKTDWKLNDVRGVLEVSIPIEAQLATGRSTASWIISSLFIAFVVGSFAIYFTIRRSVGNTLDGIILVGDQLTETSKSVLDSSAQLADSANEQAASVEETSASLEQISSMTQHNVEHVQRAKELSSKTRESVEIGTTETQEMAEAMNDIKNSGDDISKIIQTIDNIAFQTNILALNAAVEAARAGEAGAGFAVVADEVRSLAKRSAEAAQKTAEQIENSIKKSEKGVAITSKVAERLKEISINAEEMDTIVSSIEQASNEQSQGIQQVSTAVESIDQSIQSNAAQSAHSAKDSETLNAQVHSLKETVSTLQKLVGIDVDAPNRNPSVETIPSATPNAFDSFERIESESYSQTANRN